VARSNIVNPVLGRLVHDPLRGLAGDVGVETCGHGLVELFLGAAGDDADR
jgi:hypothetical protein